MTDIASVTTEMSKQGFRPVFRTGIPELMRLPKNQTKKEK